MKKQFNRYFGKNIASKLYLLGVAFLVIGVAIALFYWVFFGAPFMVVGLVLFFVTYALKISDSDIDGIVRKAEEEYIETNIDGQMLGKTMINGKEFSTFSGYFIDGQDTRFKAGSDGKVRTSRYYVTAIAASGGVAHIYATLFNLFDENDTVKCEMHISRKDKVSVKREAVEFPRGNNKIEISVMKDEEANETIAVYLPDDALADKLIEDIVRSSR